MGDTTNPRGTLLEPHHPRCFGCGPENIAAPRLTAWHNGDAAEASVTFTKQQEGAPGIAHGGAVATACDDVLGHVLGIHKLFALTQELSVRYERPVRLNREYRVTARLASRAGKQLRLTAEGRDDAGVLHFTAEALFVVLDPSAVSRIFGVENVETALAGLRARRSGQPVEHIFDESRTP